MNEHTKKVLDWLVDDEACYEVTKSFVEYNDADLEADDVEFLVDGWLDMYALEPLDSNVEFKQVDWASVASLMNEHLR